ncbi:hypothetical protein HYV12_00205 [Candidatus Dojkabacteria bacterium]|nr:hypothetical protein [Candidatus Dojkabacteria bacterium]
MSGASKNSNRYYETIAPEGTMFISDINDVPVHAYVLVQNSTAGGFSKFFIEEVIVEAQIVIGNYSGNASALDFSRDKIFRYVSEDLD